MKEQYLNYKKDYDKYILLIKNGNFYISLNNDAYIMNKLFNYKILESTNIIKTGFPITNIDKIKNELINKEINYLIIDNNIIDKYKSKNNNYDKYLSTNYKIYLNRINNINKILKDNLNKDLNNVLFEIESILCKINY